MSTPEPPWNHWLYNDRWAIEVVFKGLRGGYFVDAGAANGINGSASLVLERDFAWNGICVEPNEKQAAVIARRRSCLVDTRCLWSTTGQTLTFHQYPGRSGMSGVAGVLPHAARLEREGKQPIEELKATVSLADLLQQHRAPRTIHYLAMDIEGSESEVLRTFEFEASHEILAISVEGAACNSLLQAAGYLLARNPFHEETFEHYFIHPSLEDSVREYLLD